MKSSYIFAAKRTAISSFQGSLSGLTAPKIAAPVVNQITESLGIKNDVQELYMGCVLTAGIGQAPARQVALGAGLPQGIPSTTIGKVCGSGLKPVMLADLSIKAEEADLIIAGGMESMSQSPYILPKIRNGLRLGNGELIDSMIKDGLWDVYNDYHMGTAAELCVKKYSFTREEQDAYAAESYVRAQKAIAAGEFKNEIIPIEIKSKKGSTFFEVDEEASKFDAEKSKKLKA